MPTKQYLGDSVCVEIEPGMVKLTTVNGLGPTNTIYLEDEVLVAFLNYLVAQKVITRWIASHSS